MKRAVRSFQDSFHSLPDPALTTCAFADHAVPSMAQQLRKLAAAPMTVPWWGRTAVGEQKLQQQIAELEEQLSEERRLLREFHILEAERHAREASSAADPLAHVNADAIAKAEAIDFDLL